ncbi:MAG TPA: 50S ribosomal protein L29 [Candidatus Brocadiaceae bacterium]
MKASEIRIKSNQEIMDEIIACKREMLNLQFQWQAGETKDTTQKRKIRRKVARMKTVQREIELGLYRVSGSQE